jgi:hypothetical protein
MQTVEQSLHVATVSNEVGKAYADCWERRHVSDQDRNLEFLATRWLRRDDAKWVMEQWVNGYNEFSPDVIDKFPEEAQIRIAREGSVCLYVKLPYGCSKKLPSAKRVSADERGETVLLSSPCVRYWWD